MRKVGATLGGGLAALGLAAAAGAVTPPIIVAPLTGGAPDAVNFQSPNHDATVLLSSAKAGADHVALTVKLQATLRCGRPFGAGVVVTLPRAARVPSSIASSAVRVNGKAPSRLAVSGRKVTVGLPAVHGIICDSITDGVLKVAFAGRAALGNPSAPGTYAIAIRRGASAYSVPIAIR